MERWNAFRLLKSVDNGKLFQTFIILHAKRKETAPIGAGTTGFIQLVTLYITFYIQLYTTLYNL